MAACNFNPRSLVGNDGLHFHRDWRRFISIHVPSWGTTMPELPGWAELEISIHVPSWGTTVCPQCRKKLKGDFNPRSLVGNDIIHTFLDWCVKISIHVPSWGTTANFHKYSLFFYAINIIFLLFIIPSLFSLVLFMLLF